MGLHHYQNIPDLYTDYLMVSNSLCTATGLSAITDHTISHDKVTRLLHSGTFSSKELWKVVKPFIREFEYSEGCISIDDTIQEKPYTDESPLICWHYDHTKHRSVKGVCLISANYCCENVSLPVAVEFVRKPKLVMDKKRGKTKRKSEKSKNEHYRELLSVISQNGVNFGYVLNDSWYSSSQNMKYIRDEIGAHFIMAMKSNRKIALSEQDKSEGKYVGTEVLGLEQGVVMPVWFEQLDFPVLLTKQVFKNGDGSQGVLYLVTSNLSLTYEQVTTIYQTRWKVEEYHKSLKNNASFAKSPTKVERAQLGHFFASIIAYVKYEILKFRQHTNHFALKTKIYIEAVKSAYDCLKRMDTISVF